MAAEGDERTRTPPARRVWFVHPVVDIAFLGGLSLVVYACFRGIGRLGTNRDVAGWATTLAWVVNWPHFASTNYRLYGSRANRARFPMTAYGVPILLFCATLIAFRSPRIVAPALVKLYLLWSPYHFSGQTFGIGLVYARRAGFELRKFERNALLGFILGSFALPSARADVGLRENSFYGVRYPGLGLPPWLPAAIGVAMWAALAVFATGMLLRLVHNRRRDALPPAMLLLPAACQFVWFVATPGGNYYVYLVPFFHSLQYLFIAWWFQLKERLTVSRATPSGRFVRRTTARWAGANFLGGAVLFWALPRVGSYFGTSMAFSSAIVLASVQIHHFFVDGVIWKLHTPGSPLSATLADITGRRVLTRANQ